MIVDLELIEYDKALAIQKDYFAKVRGGYLGSALVFCRHYPVITLGRRAKYDNIKAAGEELSRRGVNVFNSERGGDVTYHGPGQQVIYPILPLALFNNDLHLFLRKLEENVIRVLSAFGIKSNARNGLTGVWVGERKICSIGISVRNWISYHGLTINVAADDLENFSLIRPCGMDIEMTSIETVIDRKIPFTEVQEQFIKEFKYA